MTKPNKEKRIGGECEDLEKFYFVEYKDVDEFTKELGEFINHLLEKQDLKWQERIKEAVEELGNILDWPRHTGEKPGDLFDKANQALRRLQDNLLKEE